MEKKITVEANFIIVRISKDSAAKNIYQQNNFYVQEYFNWNYLIKFTTTNEYDKIIITPDVAATVHMIIGHTIALYVCNFLLIKHWK